MSIDLCGMTLEHPLMNAAGPGKSLQDIQRIFRSAVSAPVLGSFTGTKRERTGNPEPNEFHSSDGIFMLNSKGLPDPGLIYYSRDDVYAELSDLMLRDPRPVILSMAPQNGLADMEDLLKLAHIWSVQGLELNLSCPNVWDASGNQKQLACFNRRAIIESLSALADLLRRFEIHDWPVGIKVSPYSDPMTLEWMAQTIIELSRHPGMPRLYVVTSNTFPNALALDRRGKSVISVKYAGMSGPALKPIALGQTSMWAEALDRTGIPVVGVGGIRTGQDVADYLHAGATAVQVGGHYWQRGERVFEEILAEWLALD